MAKKKTTKKTARKGTSRGKAIKPIKLGCGPKTAAFIECLLNCLSELDEARSLELLGQIPLQGVEIRFHPNKPGGRKGGMKK